MNMHNEHVDETVCRVHKIITEPLDMPNKERFGKDFACRFAPLEVEISRGRGSTGSSLVYI